MKPKETLRALDQYKPLVTYDNADGTAARSGEHAPNAGVVLRLRVPNTGSMVELSSKFGCDPGEAVRPHPGGLPPWGWWWKALSFHVGSQCTNFDNFVQALNIAAAVMDEARIEAGTKSRSSTSAAASPPRTTGT